MFLAFFAQPVRGNEATSPEYQIKAAFLFNFLKFVEWPKSKTNDENKTIVIGIIAGIVINVVSKKFGG